MKVITTKVKEKRQLIESWRNLAPTLAFNASLLRKIEKKIIKDDEVKTVCVGIIVKTLGGSYYYMEVNHPAVQESIAQAPLNSEFKWVYKPKKAPEGTMRMTLRGFYDITDKNTPGTPRFKGKIVEIIDSDSSFYNLRVKIEAPEGADYPDFELILRQRVQLTFELNREYTFTATPLRTREVIDANGETVERQEKKEDGFRAIYYTVLELMEVE